MTTSADVLAQDQKTHEALAEMQAALRDFNAAPSRELGFALRNAIGAVEGEVHHEIGLLENYKSDLTRALQWTDQKVSALEHPAPQELPRVRVAPSGSMKPFAPPEEDLSDPFAEANVRAALGDLVPALEDHGITPNAVALTVMGNLRKEGRNPRTATMTEIQQRLESVALQMIEEHA